MIHVCRVDRGITNGIVDDDSDDREGDGDSDGDGDGE